MSIKQKIVSPVLMWFIVFAGIFFIFKLVKFYFFIPRNVFTPFLIFPAILYWLYFFGGAILVHHKAPLSAEKIDKLVTEGVYNKVRHPIYSADIVLGWGIFLLYPSINFFLSAVWLTLVLLFWMKLEERALIKKFGNEYLEYRERVPMVLPRFKN